MLSNPLYDASSARKFLQAYALRTFVGRIPTDQLHVICLATVGAFDNKTYDVAGIGETEEQALLAAAGEAAETLSQLVRKEDCEGTSRSLPELAGREESWFNLLTENTCKKRVAATMICDGSIVGVPMISIFRDLRMPQINGPPLSEGCAAGADLNNARLSAIFELVERHAVALWWRGGHPVRLVESGLIERQGGQARQVFLLDLGEHALAPVAGVVSTDAKGRGFVFASACRSSFASARMAAMRELAQFEISDAARRERQNIVIQDQDNRNNLIQAVDVEQLLGRLAGHSARSVDIPAGQAKDNLIFLAKRCKDTGVRIATVNITRADIGVPVVKAISPDLEPSRTPFESHRIKQARQAFGVPPIDRDSISLF